MNLNEDMIFLDDIPLTLYSISANSISSSKIKGFIWLLRIYRLHSSFLKSFILILIRLLIQIIIYFTDKKIEFNSELTKF